MDHQIGFDKCAQVIIVAHAVLDRVMPWHSRLSSLRNIAYVVKGVNYF